MCKLRIFILFILFYTGNTLFGSSLPTKAFVSSFYNEEIVYIQEQSPNPADGYYDIRNEPEPLLCAPPILPPDPGEEVPVGDCLPVVIFVIVYITCKLQQIIKKSCTLVKHFPIFVKLIQ